MRRNLDVLPKKQARLTIEEKALRSDIGDVYLFTAQDQETRLIAAHLLGKRSGDNTRRFMMQLAGRLNMPAPHASDRHQYFASKHQTITQISTDGWMAYPRGRGPGLWPLREVWHHHQGIPE